MSPAVRMGALTRRPSLLCDGAGFSPSNIGGMALWFKADNISQTDGSVVSSWSDASGNGNTISQATAGNKPTISNGSLNGHNVVTFALTKYLEAAAAVLSASNKYTHFIVAKHNDANSDGSLFSNALSNGFLLRYKNNAGTQQIRFIQPLFDVNTATAAGTFSQITVIQDATSGSAGTVSVRENGALLGTSGSGLSVNGDGLYRVGADAGFNGAIAEIISYASVLSATQYGQVEAYLRARFNLY